MNDDINMDYLNWLIHPRKQDYVLIGLILFENKNNDFVVSKMTREKTLYILRTKFFVEIVGNQPIPEIHEHRFLVTLPYSHAGRCIDYLQDNLLVEDVNTWYENIQPRSNKFNNWLRRKIFKCFPYRFLYEHLTCNAYCVETISYEIIKSADRTKPYDDKNTIERLILLKNAKV